MFAEHADAILRRSEVEKRVGLSRSSIYALMAKGLFPAQIRIGQRAVGWRLSTLNEWLNSREKISIPRGIK